MATVLADALINRLISRDSNTSLIVTQLTPSVKQQQPTTNHIAALMWVSCWHVTTTTTDNTVTPAPVYNIQGACVAPIHETAGQGRAGHGVEK